MCFFFVILNLPVTFFAHKFLTFPLFVLKFLVNSLGSSGCFGFEFLNKKIDCDIFYMYYFMLCNEKNVIKFFFERSFSCVP